MMKYIIWGGTGHLRVMHELLMAQNARNRGMGEAARVVAVVDNALTSPPLEGVPLLQGEQALRQWVHTYPDRYYGIAAMGTSGIDRLSILSIFEQLHIKTPAMIHPQAFVAQTAQVEEGAHVLARACVCANAHIGRGVIVNTASIVDHDGDIDKGTHIAPGVTLAGEVRIAPYCFIGAGSTILPRISIGEHSIIGAGSVVTRSVESASVAYGVPAKTVRKI